MPTEAFTVIVPASCNQSEISLKHLKPGDVLLVKDVINQQDHSGNNLEASAVLISTPLPEARTNQKNGKYQIGAIAADMVQQIFNHLDQIKESKWREKHVQSIADARAKGIKFGRKPKERPPMLDSVRELWEQGEISAREAGRQLGISHVTFLTWVNEEALKYKDG